jgi:hypothetical protein
MPTPLFGDIQAMVKSAFFSVAKFKVRHSNGRFFLSGVGNDQLEISFGVARTMNGANRNVDILQLADTMTGATECNILLSIHKDWDSGSRRLAIKEISGDDADLEISSVHDRVHPASWKGDIRVNQVSLLTAWNAGLRRAREFLPEANEYFDSIISDPNRDLLMPRGRVVGRDYEREDGEEEEGIVADEWDDVGLRDESVDKRRDDAGDGGDGGEQPESRTGGSAEEVVRQQLAELAEAENVSESESDESVPLGTSAREQIPGSKKSCQKTITVKGKDIPISVYLRHAFAERFSSNSADRLKRVANRHKNETTAISNDHLSGDISDLIHADDPAATLLNVEDCLFVSVIRISSFKVGGKTSHAIPTSRIRDPDVVVAFQVLQLVPCDANEDDLESPDWNWNGKFEKFASHTCAKIMETNGNLITSINPELSLLTTRNVPESSRNQTPQQLATWRFTSEYLLSIGSLLLQRLSIGPQGLCRVKQSTTFPYRTSSGKRYCSMLYKNVTQIFAP